MTMRGFLVQLEMASSWSTFSWRRRMVPPWLRTVSISSALKSSLRERSGSSLRGLGSERERGEGMSCQFMRVCKA